MKKNYGGPRKVFQRRPSKKREGLLSLRSFKQEDVMNYDARKDHYKGWAPYCLLCPTMHRMALESYGWKCVACANEISWDLKHHYPEGSTSTLSSSQTPSPS